jgi:hypothetical protein
MNVQKILDVGYWWLIMNQDVYEYFRTCAQCQRTSNLLIQNLAKLVTTLLEEPLQKCGLDLIGFVKVTSKLSRKQYILVPTEYATKWVEAQTFCTNIVGIIGFYMNTFLQDFGCPLTVVIDQGTHFMNDAIRYLVNHFIFRHTSSTIYCTQGNG